MERHVVIGTAGHVDHGKTALVKALTGTDTDRLAEEKRRGITIDLGFAMLDLGDGTRASIVDVPGHEDFVRNMVAGATGVDVALLVVAADEGIMPQTEEHLAILSFLGVRSGVVAVTKSDLAEPDWLALVADEVAQRVARTGISWDAIVPTSTVNGQGIDALKLQLKRASRNATERDASDLFRLPVDRVFSLPGAGTVVTGTTWSGAARVGSEVTIFPGGLKARVRSVEVHGASTDAAEPGRRTAMALVGVDRQAVTRGSVVVTGGDWRETAALDARITLLPSSRPLTQRTRVRLHIGTAEVIARATPAGDEIPGGSSGYARLRLEQPVVARWGDRAVLRSYSPVTTIGGVQIIDPWPAARPRRPIAGEERASAEAVARVRAFVAAAGRQGLDSSDLTVRLGVHPGQTVEVLRRAAGGEAVAVGSTLFSRSLVEPALTRGLAALAEHHRVHALEAGMPREAFRRIMGPAFADHLEKRLAGEGRITIEGGTVRLAGHTPSPGALEGVQVAIQGELAKAGREGLTVDELRQRVAGEQVGAVAEFLVRSGTAIRVGRDRYYGAHSANELVSAILKEVETRGRASPAQLREAIGLTRKYLIPFLEWMDGKGLTRRDGDARGLGPEGARALRGT